MLVYQKVTCSFASTISSKLTSLPNLLCRLPSQFQHMHGRVMPSCVLMQPPEAYHKPFRGIHRN